MDRLESMSALVAAAEAGSLSAAARRLRVPLATMSRKVSDLERHLKVQLLKRTGRRLSLTEAGEAYVAACRQILDEVAEAERAASGEYRAPKGDLVVTAPVALGRTHVLPIAVEFLKAFPEIGIRLRLADHHLNLLEDPIDAAVRIGALPDSSLIGTRVGSVRVVVCANPAYLAARGTPRSPSDLLAHDCITFEGIAAPRAWTFTGARDEQRAGVRSRLAVNAAQAAVDAAVAGLGIARLLSYQAAAALESGALVLVLETFEPPPLPVHVVTAPGRRMPLKLRAFLDFLVPRLRQALARDLQPQRNERR
jgi:DNA-binding transcriptional LysR family regulator